MWIYITGCIVTFVLLIIVCLKNESMLTMGDLIAIIVFSFASWSLPIGFVLAYLLSSNLFEKPIIKRKKLL